MHPTRSTLAFGPTNLEHRRMRLTIGHSQHAIIPDAIYKQAAARTEMMMREHSHAILSYSNLFVAK
jgi:GntR family transcriptional regulator of vanillate catabolism